MAENVLIAIDSFKGSMSSLEAGNAAKAGVDSVWPDAHVTVKALADGGEGTYRTLIDALGGKIVSVRVSDPLGRKIDAHYGILSDGTAVLEMAEASGIALLDSNELNPLLANTFGFGQMLVDAYERGARDFIIGIGGSATTEAGIGMLHALGFRFYDKDNNLLQPVIGNMDLIERIDDSYIDDEMLDIQIQLACDVTNPLCGDRGAVAVFGPQKGVKDDQIELLDNKLLSFSKLVNRYTGKNMADMPGAGAAGGLGFTLASFFKNIAVTSGADLIIQKLGIMEAIQSADIVITGEGRIDNQTAQGKGPGKIAALAKERGCKVYGMAGNLDMPYDKCNSIFDEIVCITPKDMPLAIAMEPEIAMENMKKAVIQLLKNKRTFI